MLEEGRAYALAIAVQHLLRLLERRGIVSAGETRSMLDSALEELNDLIKRQVLSATAGAEGAKTIGALYLPSK
jgi:hypothetical protein